MSSATADQSKSPDATGVARDSTGKVRRIAILISSVDSATARQLMLHLPTDVAKQVRQLLPQLGDVDRGERKRILHEFQQTARSTSPLDSDYSPSTYRPSTTHVAGDEPQSGWQNPNHSASSIDGKLSDSDLSQQHDASDAYFSRASQATNDDSVNENSPEWTRLGIDALVRFVQTERPAVIAIVISQLPAETSVAILQRLPQQTTHHVLRRLASLQDIDPEALEAINTHLSERLVDYQQQLRSETQNTRRVKALLAAAPPALRSGWQQIMQGAVPEEAELDSGSPVFSEANSEVVPSEYEGVGPVFPDSTESTAARPTSQTKSTDHTGADPLIEVMDEVYQPQQTSEWESLLEDGIVTTEDFEDSSWATAQEDEWPAESPVDPTSRPSIIPFQATEESGSQSFRNNAAAFESEVTAGIAAAADNGSMASMPFESLLELPPQLLAKLLSNLPSETVLLALAGASPAFMARFYGMLERTDAQALEQRLRSLNSLRISDVDQAQHQVCELATQMNAERLGQSTIPFSKSQRGNQTRNMQKRTSSTSGSAANKRAA